MKALQRRDTGSAGTWVTIAVGSREALSAFTDWEASDGMPLYRIVGRLRGWLRS